MKRSVYLFIFVVIIPFLLTSCSAYLLTPETITYGSWNFYKSRFVKNGRVIRPENNNDTVSEGQSYVMIRSVLMNDQKIFDNCLAWTEKNLSRKSTHGDALLAWHFERGKVSDTTSASDADIDYAFSLILAYRAWQNDRYLKLANEVLASVLDRETVSINGRLYLLPWLAKNNGEELVAQNPSYYAPSHFRLFYEITGDKRWLELLDTTYDLIGKLINSPVDIGRPGVVPDWIAIDQKGAIVPLPGKPFVFGWDAVRVPIRIAADYYLYGDQRALAVLRWFSNFFEQKFKEGAVAVGTRENYDNALFYSAAYAAAESAQSSISPDLLQHLRNFICKKGKDVYYSNPDDYYANSLSWWPEYYQMKR